MSIDALQEKIRKRKCPLIVDMTVLPKDLPGEGSIGELEQLSKEHRIYVLGAQSAAYKSLLPEAVILDGYVKKELYLQPAAWEFFGAFESYVGNKALEYDALERICKTFGVKEDIP